MKTEKKPLKRIEDLEREVKYLENLLGLLLPIDT